MIQYSWIICSQSDANATARRAASHCNPVTDRSSTRPLGCSPTTTQQQFSAIRHLRKFLLTFFHRDVIFTVESRDPLEVRLFILFPLWLTSCQWSPCSALLPRPDLQPLISETVTMVYSNVSKRQFLYFLYHHC